MYSVISDQREFLLINKHPDVNFHRDQNQDSLAGAIRRDLGIKELFTVHRLDKMTSGLLLFAKNRDTARELSLQFQNKLVEKYYLALSDRKPLKKQGGVIGDMERTRRGAWKLKRTMSNPAITNFFSYSTGEGLWLFILRPRTGKTHQIRVAMKSLGSPIIGDDLYHKKQETAINPDRGYLHSYALVFKLSVNNYMFVHKPDKGIFFMKDKVEQLIKNLERPWELNWSSVKTTKT